MGQIDESGAIGAEFGETIAFDEEPFRLFPENRGDDGDEIEMPYDPEMQPRPPLQDTIDAARSNLDSQDKIILPPLGRIMTDPNPPQFDPFYTSFIPPFFEGPKRAQLQLMDASASLLPTVAAPESSYTFQGQTINGHTHITAADFRAQILNAPAPSKKTKYPFGYSDREGVAPELPHPLLHIPIVPGQKESFKDGVDDPDVLRAIYPKDRAKKGAVLARHDPEKGRTASGSGVMTRCNYHGARHRRRKQTEEDGA
ncbi:hypothetical protein ACLOAV_002664 [Pseudogymnoascus australis]